MAVALKNNIETTGMAEEDLVLTLQNIRDLVNELRADHATFRTAVNALRTHSLSRAFAKSGLAIGGTTTKYKHATQVAFIAGGLLQLSATTADHTFTGVEVITQNTWGLFLVTLAGTTWKTTPAAALMAYASEAAAIAAMPEPPANEAVMGYITIKARSTVDFTAGTTTLTADNGSGNSQTVNYYDGGLADMVSLIAAPATLTAADVTLAKG